MTKALRIFFRGAERIWDVKGVSSEQAYRASVKRRRSYSDMDALQGDFARIGKDMTIALKNAVSETIHAIENEKRA